jgi:amidase
MGRLIFESATHLANAIAQGDISAREAVEAFLNRIHSVNPMLNAVVQLREEEALQEALQADEELTHGELRGALHGVPMTIKDSFDTRGVITTWGTPGRRDHVPERDATVVARLKAAGGILLGKTNTPELTLSYATDNAVYGRANNPYNISRTPGGSSGGAAAIVAAAGSAFDIGSDTGGSIRLPAHFCGIAGLRPTAGRVPRTGHAIPPGGAVDRLTTVGPLARTIEDLAFILPIIAGPDAGDPVIAPVHIGDYREVDLERLHAGVYTDNGICSPEPDIVGAVEGAAEIVAQRGVEVEQVSPPGIDQSLDTFNDLMLAFTLPWARRALQGAGTLPSEITVEGLLGAREPTAAECWSALDRWDAFCRRMLSSMADYDLLLSPVTAYAAYPHAAVGDEDPCFSYTNTYSLTGWPVAVVRAGTTAEGLPIGVQIAAKPWREDVAFAIGAVLEGALGGWQPPSI